MPINKVSVAEAADGSPPKNRAAHRAAHLLACPVFGQGGAGLRRECAITWLPFEGLTRPHAVEHPFLFAVVNTLEWILDLVFLL